MACGDPDDKDMDLQGHLDSATEVVNAALDKLGDIKNPCELTLILSAVTLYQVMVKTTDVNPKFLAEVENFIGETLRVGGKKKTVFPKFNSDDWKVSG